MVRNCLLEPAGTGADWVGSCLRNMAWAFRFGKPAVIGSHRYNYIGSIDPANRDEGLRQLGTLLKEVVRRWPDVWFLSSPELGEMIADGLETAEALDR